MSQRSWKFLPATTAGKWSVGLIAVVPVLFAIGFGFSTSLYKSIPAGGTILGDIAARPLLALSMLAGMAAGISALITGILAMIKHKEKTLLVYVSTVLGGLLTLFVISELAFPL